MRSIFFFMLSLSLISLSALSQTTTGIEPSLKKTDDIKLTPMTGIYFARDSFVWVRERPGLQYAASYRLVSGRGVPSLAKAEDEGGGWVDWYKLDLGEGRVGFAARNELIGAENHELRLEWKKFTDEVEYKMREAELSNTGPFAHLSGLYQLLSDSCEPKPIFSEIGRGGEIYGLSLRYIWFEGNVMYQSLLSGRWAPESDNLAKIRLTNTKRLGKIQWYKWKGIDIAFSDDQFLFKPDYTGKEIKSEWSRLCKQPEDTLESLKDLINKNADKLSTD